MFWKHTQFWKDALIQATLAFFESGSTDVIFTNADLISIPKDGAPSIDNFRPLSLKRVPHKVINSILRKRLVSAIQPLLRENQSGFLPNKGCRDSIAMVSALIARALRSGKPLAMLFVDFSKAFSAIDRRLIPAVLVHYGIPKRWVELVNFWLLDETYNLGAETLEVGCGISMGCCLAPFLFIVCTDYIMSGVMKIYAAS